MTRIWEARPDGVVPFGQHRRALHMAKNWAMRRTEQQLAKSHSTSGSMSSTLSACCPVLSPGNTTRPFDDLVNDPVWTALVAANRYGVQTFHLRVPGYTINYSRGGFQEPKWPTMDGLRIQVNPNDGASQEVRLKAFEAIQAEFPPISLRNPNSLATEEDELRASEQSRLQRLNAFQKRPSNADHIHQEGMELAIEHALTDRALGEFPGDRYTVAEVLQCMIDGAKLPLRYGIAGVSLGVPTPIEPLIDHERALFNEMALGRIYEGFESAWQGVQWSGARLHRRGLEYLFDETGDLRSVESRLDVFRRTQRFTRDSYEMSPIVERRTNSAERVPVPEGTVPCGNGY